MASADKVVKGRLRACDNPPRARPCQGGDMKHLGLLRVLTVLIGVVTMLGSKER
jgi:hypothetical protein